MGHEPKHNYVLTNELLDDEGDRRLFKQVQDMAKKRGSLFVPVRLHLSKEENARRIQMPERAARFKSTKINERAYEISMIQINHPNLLDLDINNLPADVAAKEILNTAESVSNKSPTNTDRTVDDNILKEVVDLLTKRFETPVQIKSVQFLSEPERRNILLRIILDNPQNGAPTSVILKQALYCESSNKDQEALGRFARDWAGLEFLSALGSSSVPTVYGGSSNHNFVLLEDLGEVHLSLVDSLMGTNKEVAIQALKRFVQSMGQLHGDAYGHMDRYKKLLLNINPDADYLLDNLENMIEKANSVLSKFNISLTDELQQEIVDVYKACNEHEHFMTLTHGDICPDNVFDEPEKNKMHIIDFEWGSVGNALLDGTYLRMSNPTCWCVKALPEELIEPLETLYRLELMKKIPAASNDELYYNSYVCACAYWMLSRLTNLEDILEADVEIDYMKPTPHPTWKPEYKLQRPRMLARIEAFLKVANKYDRLPHLRQMAEQILAELKTRWPDVKPLEAFPAFVIKTGSKEKTSHAT
jgi:hypothetical protein